MSLSKNRCGDSSLTFLQQSNANKGGEGAKTTNFLQLNNHYNGRACYHCKRNNLNINPNNVNLHHNLKREETFEPDHKNQKRE